jgi:hypothetical protein
VHCSCHAPLPAPCLSMAPKGTLLAVCGLALAVLHWCVKWWTIEPSFCEQVSIRGGRGEGGRQSTSGTQSEGQAHSSRHNYPQCNCINKRPRIISQEG